MGYSSGFDVCMAYPALFRASWHATDPNGRSLSVFQTSLGFYSFSSWCMIPTRSSVGHDNSNFHTITRRTLTSDDFVLLCATNTVQFRSFLLSFKRMFLQSPSYLRCPSSGQSSVVRSKGSGILKRIPRTYGRRVPFGMNGLKNKHVTNPERTPHRAKLTD